MNLHNPIIDRDAGTWHIVRRPRSPARTSPTFQTSEPPDPPLWMVEAAKPCETCGGHGVIVRPEDGVLHGDCPDCDDGRQRHTITVPCQYRDACEAGDDTIRCICTSHDGTITVPELAVVEWGPLAVVGKRSDVDCDCVVVAGRSAWVVRGATSKWQTLTLPPDIDPQSLVGQFAIGGKLVTP